MHEVSVISGIVNSVIEKLKEYSFSKVNSLTVVIGKLTTLGGEQLRFAYEVVTRGTVLEGSELVIEEEEIEVACKECDYVGPADRIEFPDYDEHFIPVLACPRCGGPITVLKGQTCSIKCIDIEE